MILAKVPGEAGARDAAMTSLPRLRSFRTGRWDDVDSTPPAGRGTRGTTLMVARQAAAIQRATRAGDDAARPQASAHARRPSTKRRAIRARRARGERWALGLGSRA